MKDKLKLAEERLGHIWLTDVRGRPLKVAIRSMSVRIEGTEFGLDEPNERAFLLKKMRNLPVKGKFKLSAPFHGGDTITQVEYQDGGYLFMAGQPDEYDVEHGLEDILIFVEYEFLDASAYPDKEVQSLGEIFSVAKLWVHGDVRTEFPAISTEVLLHVANKFGSIATDGAHTSGGEGFARKNIREWFRRGEPCFLISPKRVLRANTYLELRDMMQLSWGNKPEQKDFRWLFVKE